MTRTATPTVNVNSIKAEALAQKQRVDAELAQMKKRLSFAADSDNLPLNADGEPDLAALYQYIARANAEIQGLGREPGKRTPEEVDNLLGRFIRAQDLFLVSMREAQAKELDLLIRDSEQMEGLLSAERRDLLAISNLTEKLRSRQERIAEMPSIAAFEARSDELGRLASLQSLASRLVAPLTSTESVIGAAEQKDHVALRDNAVALVGAFNTSIEPLKVYIENRNVDLGARRPIPEVSPDFYTTRNQVVDSTISLAQDQQRQFDELAKQRDIQLKQERARIEAERKAVQAQLELEKLPKPVWKRFFTAVTFGAYKGGLPNDTKPTEAKIASLTGALAENQRQLTSNSSAGNPAVSLIRDLETYRSTAITSPDEIDLGILTAGTKQFVDELGVNREVKEAVRTAEMSRARHENKPAVLRRNLDDAFNQGLVMAQLIHDGKVSMNGDGLDTALGGVQAIAGLLPVAGTAVSAVAIIARKVNTVRRTLANTSVSEFGRAKVDDFESDEAELRKEIFSQLVGTLTTMYSTQVDGLSPMDVLTPKGIKKFADTMAVKILDQVGKFTLPADREIPVLDVIKFQTDRDYREGISKNLGIVVDENRLMDPEYLRSVDTKMCAIFVAEELTSKLIHGKEQGFVPTKVTEALSKTRFSGDEVEMPVSRPAGAKAPTATFEGLTMRVGIITSEGMRYSADARADEKYHFRLATPREEAELKAGSRLPGYSEVAVGHVAPPRDEVITADVVASKTSAFVAGLRSSDFKDPDNFGRAEEEVNKFLAAYATAKKADYAKPFHVFLKDYAKSEDGFIKPGDTSRTWLGKLVYDDARTRLHELEPSLEALASFYIKHQENLARAGVTAGADTLSGFVGEARPMEPTAAADVFSRASSIERSAEERARLAAFNPAESTLESAAERNQIEARRGLNAIVDATLRGAVGIRPEGLPVVGKTLARRIATLGEKTEAAPAGPVIISAHTAAAETEFARQLQDVVAIVTPNNLVNPKSFRNFQENAETFAQYYYGLAASGMSGEEMREQVYGKLQTFMRTDNVELVKMVVGMADAYSQMQFSRAQDREYVHHASVARTATAEAIATLDPAGRAALTAMTIEIPPVAAAAPASEAAVAPSAPASPRPSEYGVRRHAVDKWDRADIEGGFDAVRSLGVSTEHTGIYQEGNKVMIPHAASSDAKPAHLVVELDHAGKVSNVTLHAHESHNLGSAIQRHNFVREIIENHNKILAQNLTKERDRMPGAERAESATPHMDAVAAGGGGRRGGGRSV